MLKYEICQAMCAELARGREPVYTEVFTEFRCRSQSLPACRKIVPDGVNRHERMQIDAL